MTLPTRRAIRPDSKHHREARRQRITTGGRGGVRGKWGMVALIAMLGLIISGAAAVLSTQPHAWIKPTLYLSIAALVCSIVASVLALRS